MSYEGVCRTAPATQGLLINRPGVAGAVKKTLSSLINSVSDPFPPILQYTLTPKPYEQGT